MPLAAADLLEPTGILTPGFFPGVQDVAAHLQAYLTAAYADATAKGVADDDRDDYARSIAYHRAYLNLANRLATNPASATLVDQGSRTYSAEQLKSARALADQYGAEAALLVPEVVAEASSRRLRSGQTITDYSF